MIQYTQLAKQRIVICGKLKLILKFSAFQIFNRRESKVVGSLTEKSLLKKKLTTETFYHSLGASNPATLRVQQKGSAQ